MENQTARPIVIGNLRFVVQYRFSSSDRGAVIRVFLVKNGRQILKFDPFVNRPHFHIDPDGRDEVRIITDHDPLAWSLRQIAEQLSALVCDAGFKCEAIDIDQPAIAAAIPVLEEQLNALIHRY